MSTYNEAMRTTCANFYETAVKPLKDSLDSIGGGSSGGGDANIVADSIIGAALDSIWGAAGSDSLNGGGE